MSKMQVYFVLALLFALSVAIFAIQNTEPISINFITWQFSEISKVLVILSSTVVGALFVMFLGLWWQLRKVMYIRQLENEIKELKNRLKETAPKELQDSAGKPECPAGTQNPQQQNM